MQHTRFSIHCRASGSTTLARTNVQVVSATQGTNITSEITIHVRTGLIDHRTCAHTYSHSHTRTRTVLAGNSASLSSAAMTTCEHSLHPHELSTSER